MHRNGVLSPQHVLRSFVHRISLDFTSEQVQDNCCNVNYSSVSERLSLCCVDCLLLRVNGLDVVDTVNWRNGGPYCVQKIDDVRFEVCVK